jgi:hypothetical protein
MEQRTIFRVSDFTGLNSRDTDTEIRDGESPDLLNIEFFQNGWRTRPSTGLIDDEVSAVSANPFVGLFEGYNDTIGYTADGKVYAFNLGSKSWNQIATGLTPTAFVYYPVFASYNGLDIVVNGYGGDAPQCWDGGSWAPLPGSPPKADDIAVWRNHVFLTGLGSATPGEVRFSELENPELWPSGNWLRPTKKESGATLVCSRVCPYPGEEDGTRLVVFADDRIYHFDGFTKALFQIFTVKKGIGCIAKRSVVSAENYTFWLDRAGIMCSEDGGYTVNNISWNIQPTLSGYLEDGFGVNTCAVHNRFKRQVWFSFQTTDGAYHDKILVYSYGLSTPMLPAIDPNARHVWSIYDISSPAMAEVTRSFEGLIGGEGTAGSALLGHALNLDPRPNQYRYFGFGEYSSGRDVDWLFKTKRFLMGGSPSQHGVLRKLSLTHQSESNGTSTLELYKDFNTTVDASDVVPMYGNGALLDSDFTLDTSYLVAGANISSVVWYNKDCTAAQFKLSGIIQYSNPNGLTVDPIEGVPGSRSDPTEVYEFYEIGLEVIPKAGTR